MVRRCFGSEDEVEKEVEYVPARRKYSFERRRPRLEGGSRASIIAGDRKRNILQISGEFNFSS